MFRSSVAATKVSNQEIVLIGLQVSSRRGVEIQAGTQDFYFKHGMYPGEMAAVGPELDFSPVSAKLLFVQFADGSTWGNENAPFITEALQMRKVLYGVLDRALLAYQS
jgi:hypothetical protein